MCCNLLNSRHSKGFWRHKTEGFITRNSVLHMSSRLSQRRNKIINFPSQDFFLKKFMFFFYYLLLEKWLHIFESRQRNRFGFIVLVLPCDKLQHFLPLIWLGLMVRIKVMSLGLREVVRLITTIINGQEDYHHICNVKLLVCHSGPPKLRESNIFMQKF